MSDYKPLTPKDIERGYFWLTHREQFKKIFFIVGILLIVLIYVLLAVNIIKYASGSSFGDLAGKMNQNYDWAAYHRLRSPQDLEISPVQIISIGNNRYNLVAFVSNPNDDWLVSDFAYTFLVNGQALPAKNSFVNAQETTMLLVSAFESNNLVSSAAVNIDNINWYRKDKEVPDIKWDIKDINFQAVSREGSGDDAIVLPASVTWTAQNLSLKNFWEVTWQIAIYSNERIVGAQEIVSSDFLSLEARDLRAVWLYNLPRVTEVKVFPKVGWLDTDNFKNIQVDPVDFR